ncbi:hypothetical protein [Cyclobacterium lianum]|uniref:hypothetical protein n=1 Tax=Cyclobacterium lianum TaxID=388280 RepID=UPI001FE47129|nr:hypothetical protein [Cyclobacterium lianum]
MPDASFSMHAKQADHVLEEIRVLYAFERKMRKEGLRREERTRKRMEHAHRCWIGWESGWRKSNKATGPKQTNKKSNP